MKIIGLTGGIACGKTVVSRFFQELGARVIDLDDLAREAVEPGREAWGDIVAYFGEDIMMPDKSINREKLGRIVFNDFKARQKLNEITHPRIGELMSERIEQLERAGVDVVIVEAALFIESGMHQIVNDMVVVYADEDTQLARLIARNHLSPKEAQARIKSQMPTAEKVKYATYKVDNSGDLKDTSRQVKEIWEKLTA